MGAELPDPRTRFLAQQRIYTDRQREQFSDTRKLWGGGSARTILEIVQRQETQQGDKAAAAAAAGDKAMTMNHNGDDGQALNGHVSEYFSNFQKSNLCGRKVPLTG